MNSASSPCLGGILIKYPSYDSLGKGGGMNRLLSFLLLLLLLLVLLLVWADDARP